MTNKKHQFISFVEDKSRLENVAFGNGRALIFQGHGDVQIRSTDSKKFTFQYALYILGLSKNLLFVREIREESPHVEVFFKASMGLVKDKRSERIIAS